MRLPSAARLSFFQRLAYASEVTVGSTFEIPGAVLIVADSARLYIPMGELVDLEAEKARLTKELENTQKQLAGVQASFIMNSSHRKPRRISCRISAMQRLSWKKNTDAGAKALRKWRAKLDTCCKFEKF